MGVHKLFTNGLSQLIFCMMVEQMGSHSPKGTAEQAVARMDGKPPKSGPDVDNHRFLSELTDRHSHSIITTDQKAVTPSWVSSLYVHSAMNCLVSLLARQESP
jgi:hypothetical protein